MTFIKQNIVQKDRINFLNVNLIPFGVGWNISTTATPFIDFAFELVPFCKGYRRTNDFVLCSFTAHENASIVFPVLWLYYVEPLSRESV